MSRRRSTYKPPRNRRELLQAIMCAVTIVVVTAVLVWVFRPNKSSGSSSTPPATATTAPASTPPASSTPASSAPTASSTPASSAPAASTP